MNFVLEFYNGETHTIWAEDYSEAYEIACDYADSNNTELKDIDAVD